MGDVLTFAPLPRPAEPEPSPTMPPAEKRARLEDALQTALDAADHIIAVLDQWDGDADLEPDTDTEPSLAAPENHEGNQVGAMRGGDEDREEEAPEVVLPEIAVEEPELIPPPILLPWRGAGNAVSAAGCAILALIERSA